MADGQVVVQVAEGHIVVECSRPLTPTEAHWLQAVALPMALDTLAKETSDPPANVPGGPDEPIPGQLAIDG